MGPISDLIVELPGNTMTGEGFQEPFAPAEAMNQDIRTDEQLAASEQMGRPAPGPSIVRAGA